MRRLLLLVLATLAVLVPTLGPWHGGATTRQAYKYICVQQTTPVGPQPPRICVPEPV